MVGVLGAWVRLEEIHAVDALAEVLPEGLLACHEQHMAVTGLVHLIAHALPHAGQAGGAPLVVVGRVAGDLVLRPQVRPLGLDAIPVHVGGSIRLGELHLAPDTGLRALMMPARMPIAATIGPTLMPTFGMSLGMRVKPSSSVTGCTMPAQVS